MLFQMCIPSVRMIQIRRFSASASTGSSGKKSITSRDNRIAGRPRFYKQVGVKEVEAPWETTVNNNHDTVQSPISAGVDGTDSASGVHRPLSSASSTYQQMLCPRPPGSVTSTTPARWFGITLDGRTVQTPMGQKLAVPSETLAYMIAAEWDTQDTKLRPVNMPLMTLACTALDQVAHHPDVYRQQSLRFLPTDTVSSFHRHITIPPHL